MIEIQQGAQPSDTLVQLVRQLADAKRGLQVVEQALKTSQMQLAHTQPVADAAHPVAIAWRRDERGFHVRENWPELAGVLDALLDAHQATTPSQVPSSHVIVGARDKTLLDAAREYAQARIYAEKHPGNGWDVEAAGEELLVAYRATVTPTPNPTSWSADEALADARGTGDLLANELMHVHQVIREYANEVESGEKFAALVALVPNLASQVPSSHVIVERAELEGLRERIVELDEVALAALTERDCLRTENTHLGARVRDLSTELDRLRAIADAAAVIGADERADAYVLGFTVPASVQALLDALDTYQPEAGAS